MDIGRRLRALREAKKLSQGDIEDRSGLKRAYVSRVENGLTVPSVDTLQKFAHALEVPLHEIFHEGEGPMKPPPARRGGNPPTNLRATATVRKLLKLLPRIGERDRALLAHAARRMGRSATKQRRGAFTR